MQGKLIFAMIALSVLSPTAAMAADMPRRLTCTKDIQTQQSQQAQQRQQLQQQRTRIPECRANRTIPWIVDPTPLFIL